MKLSRQHSGEGILKMPQYQITVDSQLLQQLFLGNLQDSWVAKLLESGVAGPTYGTTVCGTVRTYRKTPRLSERYILTTRMGTITLGVPRIRNGSSLQKCLPANTEVNKS
jgi:putative transposase